MDEVTVVGVDGWRGGWVAVVLADGVVGRVFVASTIAAVAFSEAQIIGVDIPIGFPESGQRAADIAARAVLGPRRNSVFFVPPRSVLEAADYTSARRRARQMWDRGLSAQTYALRDKILEVDNYRQVDPRLIEVHPEVSFRALAGEPLTAGKKTWNGQQQRRRLLASAGIVLPDVIDGEAGEVPVDDLLDAAVVAWTADRHARGIALSLPNDTAKGADCTIWY